MSENTSNLQGSSCFILWLNLMVAIALTLGVIDACVSGSGDPFAQGFRVFGRCAGEVVNGYQQALGRNTEDPR